MVSEALILIEQAFNGVYDMTLRMWERIGGLDFIFGIICVILVYRFILSPIFGSSNLSNTKGETKKYNKSKGK